eukprot:TRINITY_DN9749_c0_g1_i2.p1 TRINITY_DN9749_c0_g1~~TRINITY_DN9749_c0_g1_i2.p1  ORF type:complete len:270 (-),score=71.96 TRINITY_DN9749_c0_g1_i2:380-1189(-)
MRADGKAKKEVPVLVPSSFCLISRLPLFELHKKWLVEVYTACSFRKLRGETNVEYTLEFFVSLLFHYFAYRVNAKNEVAVVYEDRSKKLQELMRYRNYNEIGITLPNFTFQLLFEKIEPICILQLIKIILLERKLIFIESDCANNAIITESLLQLISPLYFAFTASQWLFVSISYLTSAMTDYIDAPVPYIVGISRDIWNSVKNKESVLAPEIAIYDMDERKLSTNEPLPAFPEELVGSTHELISQILSNREQAKNVRVCVRDRQRSIG